MREYPVNKISLVSVYLNRYFCDKKAVYDTELVRPEKTLLSKGLRDKSIRKGSDQKKSKPVRLW